MALIRITRDLQLTNPLFNIKGERIDKIRLDGSFAFNEYDNEQYLSFDRENSKWYFNLDTIILESTLPLQEQIDVLADCCETLILMVEDLQAQIDFHHPTGGGGLPPRGGGGGGGTRDDEPDTSPLGGGTGGGR